ncbi:MAG TPA: hypothetical protein VEN81_03060 [Planctomycetota bacterium]|jgi:hypothetical protein|nr:hypothetical protein [Planctomycetota bacterium]
MAHQTRLFRSGRFRESPRRISWHFVRRAHVRLTLRALAALYRRG